MKRSLLAAAALTLLTAAPARSEEQPVPIKTAPGHDAVENNCAGCHSLDYLRINSVFLDRKAWQAYVDARDYEGLELFIVKNLLGKA